MGRSTTERCIDVLWTAYTSLSQQVSDWTGLVDADAAMLDWAGLPPVDLVCLPDAAQWQILTAVNQVFGLLSEALCL